VLTVFRTHRSSMCVLIALVPGGPYWSPTGRCRRLLLVIYAGVVAFAHSNTNLGSGRSGGVLVSPELPSNSPSSERTQRRQPRLRANDLGPDGAPGGVPDARDDQADTGSSVGR